MSETHDIQSLKELSDGDLALRAENIADIMDGHGAFQEPRSRWAPTGDQLREEAQLVKQASHAARLDPTKESERVAAREKLIQTIRYCCQCIVMYATYTKDPGELDTIGVDRTHKTPRNWALKIPEKFHRFKATHGKESGSVKFHVNSWEGKASVELQFTYGPPDQESSWQRLMVSNYCHFTHNGLEAARRAFFRSRLINNAGIGPWSDVVELIIL
ncbi:fibronectin type III domain-containing protein [Geomonas ferrireducens]|uniref:fibronectin type III domain-containing protein n=1 Tax=Geomonas ferrireducens TaxID=2570227 RepID=UPI0010A86D6E|nr:fibronectin type III domain-containing protein [Geomonas ferrireducens]